MIMWHPEVTLANDSLEACFRMLKNPFIFNNYRREKQEKQQGKLRKRPKLEVSLAKI